MSKKEEKLWSMLAKSPVNCRLVSMFANFQHIFLIGRFIRRVEICILTVEKRGSTLIFLFEVFRVKGHNFETLILVKSKLGQISTLRKFQIHIKVPNM